MRREIGTFLALVALVFGASRIARAAQPRRLTGEFAWDTRDKSGDLEAVFTPTGEHRWDVAFHFSFRNESHVYSGTAEGDLGQGQLKGTVYNEPKSRTFTFKGAFADGTFSGTHAEIEDGAEHATGTLTLREPVAVPTPAS